MGYSFSGKKTIAKFLKDKYNLDVILLEELIQESIELVLFSFFFQKLIFSKKIELVI